MAIKKLLLGGETLNDPFEAVKRGVFLVASPVGSLAMLLVWGIGLQQNNISPFNIIFLPILAILFLLIFFLLWRRIILLRTFELILYALILVYALCQFSSVITTIVLTNGSFSPDATLWFPFVYILSFLILSTNLALVLSVLFFLSTLILGLVACIHFLVNGLPFQNVTFLVEVYYASGFYIAVLYLVARMRESYLSQTAVADDMSKLAMIDSLTQVDNRRLLSQYLHDEVNRAERHNLPLSILLFDLDWFKKINDSFGHNTGDKVLQEVAQLLRQNIRTSDPFGRWGGDEFLCLAINSGGEQAVELAERLRDAVQRHQFSTVTNVTASFGVTAFQRGDTPETLVRRADLGLYKAKASGRNRVEVVRLGITLPIFEGEKPQ
jgi:diguanylate cyclase (GGDEF)-like protein